jgi:NTP pyrophosphatase (non-canonical NTP hydrolase)
MINELSKQIHENAKSKGFYDKEKNIGEMLALIHSEVSEALEADRKGRYCPEIPNIEDVANNESMSVLIAQYHNYIKGTFEEEMADIVIRVMDLCAYKKIDLLHHIKAKMRMNSLREHKHGKKY